MVRLAIENHIYYGALMESLAKALNSFSDKKAKNYGLIIRSAIENSKMKYSNGLFSDKVAKCQTLKNVML